LYQNFVKIALISSVQNFLVVIYLVPGSYL